jgi:hypothetical protein
VEGVPLILLLPFDPIQVQANEKIPKDRTADWNDNYITLLLTITRLQMAYLPKIY